MDDESLDIECGFVIPVSRAAGEVRGFLVSGPWLGPYVADLSVESLPISFLPIWSCFAAAAGDFIRFDFLTVESDAIMCCVSAAADVAGCGLPIAWA